MSFIGKHQNVISAEMKDFTVWQLDVRKSFYRKQK